MKIEKGVTVAHARRHRRFRYASTGRTRPASTRRCSRPRPTSTKWTRCRPIRCFCGARPGRSSGTSQQGYAYVHADVRGAGQSEGEFSFMGPEEQQDLSRADRLDHQAAVVQRPRRRHRPIVLRDGAVADGDLQPAGARLHRALRRLVDQYRCSNYHGGIYCSYRSVWYTTLRADNQHRPRRPAGPAADEVRPGRRDHRPLARRRVLAGALAVLAARQDQVPGAVDRPLGQDGPAPARQHRRLRGGEGAEEARGHRRAQHLRSAQDVRPGRFPREGMPAVLRPASQGQEQRLHGSRAGASVRARRQCLARRGSNGRPSATQVRPTICARARRAASRRSTTAGCRPTSRRRANRPRATPIRTGSGSTASRSSARTAGSIRCGAC